jgi:hypothetical protein
MRKRTKISLLAIVLLVVLLAGAFMVYVSDYYRADATAHSIIQSANNLRIQDNMMILSPAAPGDTALIFYPGAKVEYTAYVPILEKLCQNGIACVLIKMPFNMAIFDQNAADKAFHALPDIKHWYIGGHSMGGAMASAYAAKHKDKVEGLILLGAYIYGDVSPENALTVYGTLNANLEAHISYTENIVVIQGGNHAQFGNYGAQRGDPPAAISREEQQDTAVRAILDFIQKKSLRDI